MVSRRQRRGRGLPWSVIIAVMISLCAVAAYAVFNVIGDIAKINAIFSELHELYKVKEISKVEYLHYSAMLINSRDNIYLTIILVFVMLIQAVIIAIQSAIIYENMTQQ